MFTRSLCITNETKLGVEERKIEDIICNMLCPESQKFHLGLDLSDKLEFI